MPKLRLRGHASSLTRHAAFGYFFAAGAVALTYALRVFLQPLLSDARVPFLMFQSPVILSALFCGIGPGLVAAGLGGVVAIYTFMDPASLFAEGFSSDVLRLGVFGVEGVLISFLGGLHRSKKQALARLLQDVKLAFAEREKAADKARVLEVKLAGLWRVNTMGEMTASLAHQLGHPIVSIINYAQALIRLGGKAPSEAVVGDALREIAKEAQRAADYVNSLRSFLKCRKPDIKQDSLAAILDEVTSIVAADAAKQGVELAFALQERESLVWVDRIQIEQVILNLLRNGIESMSGAQRPGNRLLIETAWHGPTHVCTSIRDQGCGIPQEELDQIFEPFFTTKSHGMGLGLAISRSIVEAHSGRLWAKSELGAGTSIHFTLPIIQGVQTQ